LHCQGLFGFLYFRCFQNLNELDTKTVYRLFVSAFYDLN